MELIAPGYQPYVVIGLIILLFSLLFTERVKPTKGFLFIAVLFVVLGILKPRDVLEGFANESIMSIVLLIVITAGIRSNYNIQSILDFVFKRATTYRKFLGLMMAKVAILSSFVNNTPVVVLMTPYVFQWGKKNQISPSKLLIPLSYATIVGGMITVIGTSTTLVLNGFLQQNRIPAIDSLNLLYIGGAISVVCILFILILGNHLLPSRKDLIEKFEQSKREYLIEKRLSQNSELIGKSVKDAGLRNMMGIYLVEIIRNDNIISPVNPNEVIEANDILIFAGNTDTIVDLTLSNIGIELPPNLTPSGADNLNVVETVISANSSLIGRTIKASSFRERYDAAVVAVHRNGEKLSGKIGRITIKAGDVLLLFAGRTFESKVDIYKDLYIISGADKEIRQKNESSWKLYVLGAIIMTLLLGQLYNLFISLLIITSCMVAMRLITLQNLKRDLDPNLIIILVLSLALGQAMIKTGAGALLAHSIVDMFRPFGVISLLIGLTVMTTILTAFITNVGAVSIAFPIALAVCSELQIDGAPFYLGIAFAASAAFISPIGYQTNLIVFGPGGYSFKDFLKIGLPVTIIYLTLTVTGIMLLYPELLA